MVVLANGAESGTADTTTVTAGNSGGGRDAAFDTVTIGGSDALTFDNTQIAHGSHCYKLVPGNSGTSTFLTWIASLGTQTTIYGRIYFYLSQNPVANNFGLMRALSGLTVCCRIHVNTAGALVVQNGAGTNLATFTNALTLNAWNRIEFAFTMSTTAGTYDVRLYPGDSTTATETKSGSGANLGAASCDRVRFGQAGGANQGSSARTFYFDDIQVNTDGFPGPPVPSFPNRPPQPRAALMRSSR